MANLTPRTSSILLIVSVVLLLAGFVMLTTAPIGLAILTLLAGVAVFTIRTARGTRRQVRPWNETFLGGLNPYERVLVVGGGLAVVVGGFGAIAANNAAASERSVNQLVVTMGGLGYYDADAGATETGWMVFWIVVAILGALSLLGFAMIRAARR
ncbi:hypothetical protein C5D25_07355 [Rathayibacter sp. AY1D7]|uniref:hypothetical protein n=1 Tax=Rathayibacter sp. AY1D7 TaxID=2080547 RepID=UPI000CE753F7|nr:hypothetical protein [Rathayibacter sp. AY1D7]PPH63115.1 hypothetical protein C5D25_07355 [Rathayibacter sp. AY1D7]